MCEGEVEGNAGLVDGGVHSAGLQAEAGSANSDVESSTNTGSDGNGGASPGYDAAANADATDEESEEDDDDDDPGNADDADCDDEDEPDEKEEEASNSAPPSAPGTQGTAPAWAASDSAHGDECDDDDEGGDQASVPKTPAYVAPNMSRALVGLEALASARESSDDPIEEVVGDKYQSSAAFASTPKRTKTKEMRAAALREKGYTDQAIKDFEAVNESHGKRQRRQPLTASPTSPELIAFYAGRDNATLECDFFKAIRRDGGSAGPLEQILKIIEANTPEVAAEVLCSREGERLTAIRRAAAGTLNELRRRRAVDADIDPNSVKYLRAKSG